MTIWACSTLLAQGIVVTQPDESPLVDFRITFRTGSASDPEDKPGVACLTAAMLAEGGTRQRTYQQVLAALFPMATSVSATVDKEMTTFSATTHADNLDAFYNLFRSMLFEPGWREDDFKRLKDDAINYLRVNLRGNNDEELGKEVLYNTIYNGHPYGHENTGTVSALQKITLNDLKTYYASHYTLDRVTMGLAGGFTQPFLVRLEKDFAALPKKGALSMRIPAPRPIEHNRVVIVDKDTRSVAFSAGFPIAVRRGSPDYVALLVVQAYLGQHRMSGGRLFQRMRELRGLNYGDYAYIEYFPRGMFQFEPSPNLARQQQIFQIWIRPVEPQNAQFALRLAVHELDGLIQHGLSKEDFERTRTFVSKYINVLMKTNNARLGYAIDSKFYNIPDYAAYVRAGLNTLTLEHVNAAIKRHLAGKKLTIVAVTRNGQELKDKLASDAPSLIAYNSPKPENIVEEDKIVANRKLELKPENIEVIPVDRVFE
jgi:zinc protease